MKLIVDWLIEWPASVARYFAPLAPLLARITVGWVFMWAGWGKLMNLPQVTENFIGWGIPFPYVLTPFVSAVEFGGGLMLLLGLFTRLAAAPLIVVMIVAIISAKWDQVDSLETLLGFEEVADMALFFWLAVAGPGCISRQSLEAPHWHATLGRGHPRPHMTVFAFLAGLLSTLSPCVLPLLPIVLAAAAGEHMLGPLALAAGVAVSFVTIGMLLATVGFAAGLDQAAFRIVGGLIMVVIGFVLAVPRIELAFATATAPVSNFADSRFGGFATTGLTGQFALGLLLGTVWSPCVGPTLGAASVLASQGKELGHVAATMGVFGLGAALPLVVLGLLSREAMMRWRGRLLATGKRGKLLFGGFLIVVGAMILTGLDKQLEAWLVELSPAWLTELTTRF